MQIKHISHFTNGWFIGDFEPSLIRTKDFEIAHHFYPAGFLSTPHYHAIATEVNYIVSGKVLVRCKILKGGDMWIYKPFDVSNVEFLEDTNLIIIKTPSVPTDKYQGR